MLENLYTLKHSSSHTLQAFCFLRCSLADIHSICNLSDVCSQLCDVEESEVEALANHTNRHVVFTQLCLLCTCLQGLETVLDEVLPREGSELLVVLLEVGLGRLRSSADGHGDVLVVVARGACLEQVGASLVN